jgi:cell division protein ZapA (FtsZ GTPase activity inhibitor)
MESQIQIELLGQSYRVRVAKGEEDRVVALAKALDERLHGAMKQPGRTHLRAAVMTAFSLMDEVYRARLAHTKDRADAAKEINALTDVLADVLTEPDDLGEADEVDDEAGDSSEAPGDAANESKAA